MRKKLSRRRYRAATARLEPESRQRRDDVFAKSNISPGGGRRRGAGGATVAHADGVPGLRGHDHTGITVPDIKQAVDFFTDVVGCKEAMSFGPFADDKGTFMQDLLNVNPRAVIDEITLVRCGYGSNIELFQYTSPDQKTMTPKNSDIGGFHIAFYVDDVKAAKDYLDSKGVKTMFGPFPVNEGPAAGQTHPLFPRALGPAAGSDQLSEGHGLREELGDGAVVPEDPAK